MRKALVLAGLVAAIGCGTDTSAPPSVATPTFSPAAGTYASTQTVTIGCTTSGAAIYYTVDGTTPTSSSTRYTAPLTVSSTQTIQAIATASGSTDSAVASATYTFSGTEFATLCQQASTTTSNLLATCLHANPEYVATALVSTDCAAMQKEITAGRVTYDQSQGAACGTAYAALTCEQLGADYVPPDCKATLTGAVANGSPCYVDEDCANGWCTATKDTCPGTCATYVARGGSCNPSDASCAPGTTCLNGTCLALGTAGAPCPCQPGLFCAGFLPETSTCQPLQTSGPCFWGEECALGYVCDNQSSFTCLPRAGLGGSCAAASELCDHGYRCDAATQKCVGGPYVGEACGMYQVCVGGYCDPTASKCTAYKALGAACSPRENYVDVCGPENTCDSTTLKCVPAQCRAP